MADYEIGKLLKAFANCYWSVSVEFVKKIMEWHPEVTPQQIQRVLEQCNEDVYFYECYVEKEGEILEEPELVVEHLTAFGLDDLQKCISARIPGPYADCDENMFYALSENQLDIPEVAAIYDFVMLDLGWRENDALDLVAYCLFCLPCALVDGRSWVEDVIAQEKYSGIKFQTIEQLRRLQTLGNRLYQVLPNPVLRGWRPTEIENPPVLPDAIPM